MVLCLAEWHGLWADVLEILEVLEGLEGVSRMFGCLGSGSEICGNDGFPGLGRTYI